MPVSAPGQASPRPAGRPRHFDAQAAVEACLPVFRTRGFHAASITELGEAMQLTVGSIYKAYGDKRSLFLVAFDRYAALRSAAIAERLAAAEGGRDKLAALLRFYAVSSIGEEGRRGCLVVSGAVELAGFDPEMAGRVTAALARNEALLRELILLGQADGTIPATVDGAAAARTMLCLLQGLRVVGKAGMNGDEAEAVVQQALRLLA